MKKYMKFTMYDKERKDKRYRENPYRAENFRIDAEGNDALSERERVSLPVQEGSQREPIWAAGGNLRVRGLQRLSVCGAMQENGKKSHSANQCGTDGNAIAR